MHPDDLVIVDGIPVTSIARTLIDSAEGANRGEVRALSARARELGLLDMGAVAACRAHVEWRPCLAVLDEVIAEFS